MKSIVLLVLVLLIGGGVCFWYNSNEKARKIAEARKTIETARRDIEQYQKKIDEPNVQREKTPQRLT